jgi:pimeloyl-ACP methyl ester carboxylesterase
MLYFQVPWLPESLFNLFPLAWARFFFRGTAVNRQAFTDADLLRMAEANARPGAMQAMLNWYRAAARFPPLRHTRRITAPTRIIWAEEDVALNRSLTEDIRAWYGEDFRIDYIPHCGHWVQNEAPEQVNRLLVEFLAGEK